MTYRGYEITIDKDECGEKITYVETDGGPVDVADVKAARTLIDGMIEDSAEFERGY